MKHKLFVGKATRNGFEVVREIASNQAFNFQRRGFVLLTDDDVARHRGQAPADDGNSEARAALKKMKKPELLEIAADHEIEIAGKASKPEIIEILIAARNKHDQDRRTALEDLDADALQSLAAEHDVGIADNLDAAAMREILIAAEVPIPATAHAGE